jgi:DNA polymerase-1
MAGKVTNHSNKYRIGAAKMMITAKVQYGIDCSIDQARQWQSSFHRSFPGIKQFWKKAILSAQQNGYAETLGGRRFTIPHNMMMSTDKDVKWRVESSAINMPIQGSGADMKELAIATVYEKYPELIFAFDLHDGLFYWAPIGTPVELYLDVQRTLDSLNYGDAWGWEQNVPLNWDGEAGPSWADMKDIQKLKEAA